LLHVPPALCFRGDHARKFVVRALASDSVDDADEFSGLNPIRLPMSLPSLPQLTVGDENAARIEVAEACETASRFLMAWNTAATKLTIDAPPVKINNNDDSNDSRRNIRSAADPVQRAATTYFAVQQQCFQPGGSSVCEFVLNAPAAHV